MNLPGGFVEQMNGLLGDKVGNFLTALETDPPVSIRINPGKLTDYPGQPVEWCPYGRYLQRRPRFADDPLFHAGAYYVQEASSMALHHVLEECGLTSDPLTVLDLCAAPGGKSTLLLSSLHPESLVVSNEVIQGRIPPLRQNLIRWGFSNYIITSADVSLWKSLGPMFDLVVVDAPCSGEGMFRKDHVARSSWNPGLVEMCAARQHRILEGAYTVLKNDGHLIYSTCTFNKTENINQLDRFATKFGMLTETIRMPESVREIKGETAVGYQFYPHRLQGEGFFIGCLKKGADHTGRAVARARGKIPVISKSQKRLITPWISEQSRTVVFIDPKGIIRIFPESHQSVLETLHAKLPYLSAGTPLGEIKGKSFIPHHGLAMSVILNKELPRTTLDLEQSLHYISKDRLFRPTRVEGGWSIVNHEGLALGWIKTLPHRINNYYPISWRRRV